MRNSKTYLHPFQDELVYYPKKNGKECEFCGLSSIAHKHKPGTLPKDYERIEDEPMSNSTQNKCEHDWAYDSVNYSTKRICRLCNRKESRGFDMVCNYEGNYFPSATEWRLLIEDIDYEPKPNTR